MIMAIQVHIGILDEERLFVQLLQDFLKEQTDMEVPVAVGSIAELFDEMEEGNGSLTCLLVDLKTALKGEEDVLERMKCQYPAVKTLVLSSDYKLEFIGHLWKAGVHSFIPKWISPEELLGKIREVCDRGYCFSIEEIEYLRGQISSKVPKPVVHSRDTLSSREIEVLKMIGHQFTAKEIGDKLHISPRTVETHKSNLFLKTGMKNIAGLMIYAVRHQLINLEEIALLD